MKVLLVEDDVFFQKFYASKLSEQTYEVETASNGEEGLQKATTFQPDIIILDIIMPIKNGFEFLAARAQDAKLKNVPVIVFSTLGQEEDVKKAMDLGANDFVNKALFDFEAVKQKIQTMVKK